MGCFLGCFGGEKDQKRRKRRSNRTSPQSQRSRVRNLQQPENVIAAEHITSEQITAETPLQPTNLDLELQSNPEGEEQLSASPRKNSGCGSKPEGEQQLSASPRKRVTFSSNVTTYEHVSVHEIIDSLPEWVSKFEEEEEEGLKQSSQSHSTSEDDNSVISSIGSYPPNHRYHNARDSDDELEVYGDSDLDDYNTEDEEGDDDIDEQDGWSESVYTTSMESRVGNLSQTIDEEIESPTIDDDAVKALGPKANARDRGDYVHLVLNPVENISQWKAAKSRGIHQVKPQKENLTAIFEAPRAPSSFKLKTDQMKNANQEIAVDASLSNWLASPETTLPKKTSFNGLESIPSGKTMSEGSVSAKSLEDRPILGAWTIDELRHISATSTPRKSPSRSPDEMPIIGTVGSYWNHSSSAKHSDSASSYKGIPNTTSKYREDKRVNWHSTPFETRLDRALNRGATEA